MNAWKTFDRGLEYLFLRLYAKNLARSFRSEPENASTDTEIQVSTMVVMAIFAIVLMVSSVLFPVYLQKLINGGDWSIALLIVVVVALRTEYTGVSAATRLRPSLHAKLMDLEITGGLRLSIGR